MGGFGNYLGATMGGSYDESFVTNSYYPDRHLLLANPNDLNSRELLDLSENTHDSVPGQYRPNSDLLGPVQGLLGDNAYNDQVGAKLTGGNALNWEEKTFKALRDERNALNVDALRTLSTAWKDHGETVKTSSETFKESVGNAITGKWEGKSAEAAEAATQHVTKTSIVDFTPASEGLADRLTVLKEAFEHIRREFPTTADAELIYDGNFNQRGHDNQQGLEQAVNDFNSKYHLDESGHLRNNSDGYVSASDAVAELEKIKRSTEAYRDAVSLFNNTYNPTVQAVTANFPALPALPNTNYALPPGGPGTGPGTGPVRALAAQAPARVPAAAANRQSALHLSNRPTSARSRPFPSSTRRIPPTSR